MHYYGEGVEVQKISKVVFTAIQYSQFGSETTFKKFVNYIEAAAHYKSDFSNAMSTAT